jgi:uncharacterized protein YutE (UPF0331/DUF86 family)
LALNEGGYLFRIPSTWTSSFDLPSVTYLTVQILGSIIDLAKTWKEKRTARYKQIAETLKRTFVIPQDIFLQIRDILKQSFDLRDMAVHPKYGTNQPVLYPEINKFTDWRYSTFRYANAKAIVGHALSIIYQTARQKQDTNKEELKSYCENLVKQLDPTLSKWEGNFGKLF